MRVVRRIIVGVGEVYNGDATSLPQYPNLPKVGLDVKVEYVRRETR